MGSGEVNRGDNFQLQAHAPLRDGCAPPQLGVIDAAAPAAAGQPRQPGNPCAQRNRIPPAQE